MKKILRCLALTLLLITTFVRAEDDLPEGFRTKPSERFIVSKNRYFLHPEIAIKNQIASDKKK